MVDNVSFTRRYDKNPLNFKHFDINSIGIFVNGESLPAQPIKCNFNQDHFLDA